MIFAPLWKWQLIRQLTISENVLKMSVWATFGKVQISQQKLCDFSSKTYSTNTNNQMPPTHEFAKIVSWKK